MMNQWVIITAGTGFIFLMTSFGSFAAVLFKRRAADRRADNRQSDGLQSDSRQSDGVLLKSFLGFAAGVMIAASVWSLLIPAIEEAELQGHISWIPAAGGFILGSFFIFCVDKIMLNLRIFSDCKGNMSVSLKRAALMVLAITVHNIPEGMVVGLSFARAVQHGGSEPLYAAAVTLAIGIGIQNFPEGAAVSLPLRQEGFSRGKAILFGCVSGVVEPVFGIIAVIFADYITPVMPWLLSFAAGAMVYVVVSELIPEINSGKRSYVGTFGVIFGFVIMMALDVGFG
jgi:ZIP family zinc transporter